MTEQLFILICEIILGIAAIIGIGMILAATWYDLRTISQKKHLQATTAALVSRRQPMVTILVHAHNNAATITGCLESILSSQYEKYHIVVADNGSSDDTKKAVLKYQREHPKIPLLLYGKKAATDRSLILTQAYKKAKPSQLVLILNATEIIPSTLLLDSVTYFAADEHLDALRLRPLLTSGVSIGTLSDHLLALHRNIVVKSLSLLSFLPKSHIASGMVLKSTILQQQNSPRKINTHYASALTYLQPTHTPKTPILAWQHAIGMVVKLLSLMLIFSVITYFLYTAATLQSNILFTLSWIVVCLWLLAIIWSDDIYRLNKKIELTLSVPFMYFIFYTQIAISIPVTLWKLIQIIPRPRISFEILQTAIQIELYSTRY